MRNEVKQIAQALGFNTEHKATNIMLERFYDQVAAAEREACAKVCEDMSDTEANMNKTWRNGCRDSANAIRARGQA
jgi:hypothetical protein